MNIEQKRRQAEATRCMQEAARQLRLDAEHFNNKIEIPMRNLASNISNIPKAAAKRNNTFLNSFK